jgi:DNA-directed RNA polymerase subunit RPC12/RpoP
MPKTVKVQLFHLVAVERDLPTVCPKCGADFTDPKTARLVAWHWADRGYLSWVDASGEVDSAGEEHRLSPSADSLGAHEYRCSECSTAVASVDEEPPAPSGPPHEKDEDCDVDPSTDLCRACSVHHGAPCHLCGGRGFHKPVCPEFEGAA